MLRKKPVVRNSQHIPSASILQKIAHKLAIPLPQILSPQEKSFDEKLKVDVIKVYVAASNYQEALVLIADLEAQEDLHEYLRRDVILGKAECLIRTGKSLQALDELLRLQQQLEDTRETDDVMLAYVHHKIGTA
jgi:HTH-type transcriptional regulator, quorum sensing regulator NprR